MNPTHATEHDAREAQGKKVKVAIRKLDRIETTDASSGNSN
jgi:hypothetical protein